MGFGELLVKKEVLTNLLANILLHVGTPEMMTGIELLLGVAVDLSAQPEWQNFWKTNLPSCSWRCAYCFGTNGVGDRTCFLCGQLHEGSESSPEFDASGEESSGESQGT